jgi:hypothetical protein
MADPPAGDPRGTSQRYVNRGTVNTTSDPSVARNLAAHPEINNLFMALASVKMKVSPDEFHRFMGRNERYIFPLLNQFRYSGSSATPQRTYEDFDRAYWTWRKRLSEVSSSASVDIPPPAPLVSDDYWRQKMWQSAVNDPSGIAAVVIVSGASKLLGGFFGFEQDPRKAAVAGEAISILVQAGGSLNTPHPVNQMVREAREREQRQWGSKDPTRSTGIEPSDRQVEARLEGGQPSQKGGSGQRTSKVPPQLKLPAGEASPTTKVPVLKRTPRRVPQPPVKTSVPRIQVAGGDTNLMSQFDKFLTWAKGTIIRNPHFTSRYYTVISHGTPTKLEIDWYGKKMIITHRALERLIRQDPAFKGQDILMLVCNAGTWTRGIAQGLAQRLGVAVIAPNNKVWAWSDFRPFVIGDAIYGNVNGVRTIIGVKPNGSWLTFTPRSSAPPP